MSSPKFAETHNVVAFLEKLEESDGFVEIIDFLKASSISYALTVNPVIYTSCIEQFWATAKWKYFIHTITQCLSAKSTEWNEFNSSMASLIICLATNQKFNLSKYIFDAMVKHLDGGVKFLLYPRKDFSGRITPLFDTMMVQPVEEIGEDSDNPTDSTPIPIIDQPSSSSQPKKHKSSKKAQRQEAEVLDLQKAKDAQAKEIDALKKRIQRLERRKMSRPTGLKRLNKIGMFRRVESSED
ncbi:hypothetical protein Tco_1513044, partial [Tanacetum coccineum]